MKSISINEYNENLGLLIDVRHPLDYAKEHEDSMGMGSTLVVAILTNDFLIFEFFLDFSFLFFLNYLYNYKHNPLNFVHIFHHQDFFL